MIFEENIKLKKLGRKIGFFVGCLVFFSILYFMLGWLDKIPKYILYWHVLVMVIIISGIYLVIKR